MRSIRQHLTLRNPRFRCRDTSGEHELVVPLESRVGEPATRDDLARLRRVAGDEAEALTPLYTEFNGAVLHTNGETSRLVVAPIAELEEFNTDWRDWFEHLDPGELYDFQRSGIAFAAVAASGNYFVMYQGRVYYSDHDGGDDAIWGANLEEFFERALSKPARLLYEAGCHTRYSDGETERQFIPESFIHE